MKSKLLGLMTVAAAIGFTQVASAIPYPSSTGLLIYDSGANASQTVALDVNGNSSYSSTVGDWTVVLTTGSTINGGASPQIDLDVTSATPGTGAGTLYIFFTSGLFGPTVGTWALSTTINGSGSLSSYVYESTSLPLAAGNQLGGGADPGSYNGALNSSGQQYYLAIEDVISVGQVVSADSNLTVPDGGTTVMLLGAALSGLALVRKARRA